MHKEEKLLKQISTLERKVKIYEQALLIYGNPENYGDRGEFWKIVIDGGKIARKALEEGEHG